MLFCFCSSIPMGMDILFVGLLLAGILWTLLTQGGEAAMAALLQGGSEAVTLCLKMWGGYMFWLGLMEVGSRAGLMEGLSRLLAPVIKKLFPRAGKAAPAITMNLAANILGMGNAATPMGIKAMSCLDRENANPLYASDNMCMLVVLNTTSIQLIPTTIIALRAAASSADPFSIILPIWISSLTAVLSAVSLAKLYFGRKKL